MKNNKNNFLLPMILASMISVPVQADSIFSDVPADSPYAKYISNLKNKGVANGIGDGKFGPTQELTRAQFATFLVKAFNLSETKEVPFVDIQGHWASFYIKAAYAAGVVNGTSETTFAPDAKVRREEAAVMIWRYLQSHNIVVRSNEVNLGEKVDAWAEDAVKNIVAHKLFGPEVTKDAIGWKYRGLDIMNRQEMSALIDLAMEKLNPTRPQLPLEPTSVIQGQLGSMQNPAVPKVGMTMVITMPDGTPSRTTQIIDILNPTENKSNLIYDSSTGKYKLGNIPKLITVSDGDQQYKDVYEEISNNANKAAEIFSKLTFTFDRQGNVTMQLPDITGSGLFWKYWDEKYQVQLFSGNSFTFKEMNLPENMNSLYLDKDQDTSKITFPGAIITLKNLGNHENPVLTLIYSAIDIN